MSVTDILVDFAVASFFIAVGQLLRAKVPLVQKFFIPPSMIAGFIALALGAQGLGILSFSENIGSYASVLIILIFAGVLHHQKSMPCTNLIFHHIRQRKEHVLPIIAALVHLILLNPMI